MTVKRVYWVVKCGYARGYLVMFTDERDVEVIVKVDGEKCDVHLERIVIEGSRGGR